MNIQVRIPDDKDADWLVEQILFGVTNSPDVDGCEIDIGRGQRINGIPLNTILVTVED